MIITLTPDLRIDASDGINFTLQRRVLVADTHNGKKTKNAGQERWDALGYYASLEQACLALLRKAVLFDSDTEPLTEAVKRIENAAKSIVVALRGKGKK